MPSPTTDAADAISARVMRGLIEALGGARRPFYSFVGGGIPVESEWLDELGRWPAAEDASALERGSLFASYVNTVPPIVGPWRAEGERMDALYRDWLERAVVPAAALGAVQSAEYARALDRVAELGPRYRSREQEVLQARRELEQAHAGGADFRALARLRDRLARATTEWARGGRAAFETARATTEHYAGLGFSVALRRLRERRDGATAAFVGPGGVPFAPARLSIAAPASAAPWIPCLVDPGSPAQAPAPEWPGLWVVERGARRPLAIPCPDWQLRFELARVALDRSAWFDDALLRSQAWWWPGASVADPTAGGPLLSDGAPPPATRGLWPLTVVEVVLARELAFELPGPGRPLAGFAESAADADRAGVALFTVRQAGASALCAPFDVQLDSPGRLSAPRPQIIAFGCELMPAAPNPDPSLLAPGCALKGPDRRT